MRRISASLLGMIIQTTNVASVVSRALGHTSVYRTRCHPTAAATSLLRDVCCAPLDHNHLPATCRAVSCATQPLAPTHYLSLSASSTTFAVSLIPSLRSKSRSALFSAHATKSGMPIACRCVVVVSGCVVVMGASALISEGLGSGTEVEVLGR